MSNTASQADRILTLLDQGGYGFQVYNRGGRWLVTYDGDAEGHVSTGATLVEVLAQVAMVAMCQASERVHVTALGVCALEAAALGDETRKVVK